MKQATVLFISVASFVLTAPDAFAGRMSYEQRLDQLERANQINVELLNKVNELQDEVAKLRGVIDEQQHELGMINKRQESLFGDLDQRLDDISKTSSSEKKKLKEAVDSNIKVSSASTVDDTTAYNRAYDLVAKKQFKEAQIALSDFIWRYPNSELVANAHYWIGEIHLHNWRFDKSDTLSLTKAKDTFNYVGSNYKEHHKSADSMVKLGMIAEEEGDRDRAKQIYKSIANVTKYSSSSNIAKLQLEKMEK